MLVDKNGNKVVEGCYIRLIGCNVKNDNGIYIVETDYNTNENVRTHDEYLLEKVNTDGTKSKAKYNLFFLDGVNPQKRDKNLDFEVVTLENLKKARKEVSDFLKGITAGETVYTFTDSEVKTAEELKKGMVVKIINPLLLQGHINRFKGSYIVKSVTSEGFTLHLLGKKGKEVASSFNCYTMQESYYQGQPVTLKFKAEVIQQLFDENYIIIQERNETTKGELKQAEQSQKEEQKTETEETTTEIITEATEEKTEEQTTETNTEKEKEVEQMERKYYEINENMAYSANMVNSFREYKKDSATETYKYYCDKVYDILDEIREKKPSLADKAEGMTDYYCRKLAEYYNDYYRNEASCPSIMISGGSNFPVRKKEKQNSRRETLNNTWNYLQDYARKIKNLLTQEQPILSKDENAIEKLQEKIATLEHSKELMKDLNKFFRKGGKIEDYNGEITEKLKSHIDFMIRQGWQPQFDTTNINAEIKRLKGRLEQLQKAKEEGTTETTTADAEGNELFTVVKNTEIMRLQLIFDGKPEEEVRNILKKNGFRWSPHYGAWQRQLTDNAIYSLKRVTEAIKAIA